MKELSIEQKAKRYDEAIEKAKSKIRNDKDHVLYEDDVIEIFPELKESEDIVGHLISYFKRYYGENSNARFAGLKVKDIFAWLEKQGEKEKFIKKELDCIRGYRDEAIRRLQELEKQGEQKPAEEIEPTPIFKIGDILKRKGKDYTFIVDRIQGGYYHCDRNHGAFFPIEEQDDWELVEQKPAEWSEEDEKMIENIIDTINMSIEDCDVDDIGTKARFSLEKERDWLKNKLKSLRPQNHWKPSDEQMYNLSEAAHYHSAFFSTDVLIGLYDDLKKLREEDV